MKSSPNLIHAKDAQNVGVTAFQWEAVDLAGQKLANNPAVIREAGSGNGQNVQTPFAFPSFDAGLSQAAANNSTAGSKKVSTAAQAENRTKAAGLQPSANQGASEKRSALTPGAEGQLEARPFFLDPPPAPNRMRFIKGSEPEANNAFAGWLPDEFNAEVDAEPVEIPDFEALREQIITETLAMAKIQAQEQTERALSAARSQAEEICRKAQAEASEVTRQAYREGIAAAQAEATEMLTLTRTVVEEVRRWREDTLAQSEPTILGLVKEIAQKIFGQGLVLDADVLKTTFSSALAEAKSLGDLRVRAHPEDAAILGALWPTQMTAVTGQKIELVPNQDLERGSCYIEGQYGSVDARVKTQMRLVNETLDQALAKDTPQPINPFTTCVEEEAGKEQ